MSSRSRRGRSEYSSNGGWPEYVPVGQRIANAENMARKLTRKGQELTPVAAVSGRKIASTFWGGAWCTNLERYSDFENRLPRGRSYLKNGLVIDLRIEQGRVRAQVMGTDLYRVDVTIATLPAGRWEQCKRACAGKIGSFLELVRGELSDAVMAEVTHPARGLFPEPGEIRFRCSCPDFASLCKHVAATLYGVGVRLDTAPESLFTLRGVNGKELITEAAISGVAALTARAGATAAPAIAGQDLADLFGIDLDDDPAEGGEPLVAASVVADPVVTATDAGRRRAATMPVKAAAKTKAATKAKAIVQPRAAVKTRTVAQTDTAATTKAAMKTKAVAKTDAAEQPKARAVALAGAKAKSGRQDASAPQAAPGPQVAPGTRLRTDQLAALGVPASTVQSWVRAGTLLRTGQIGLYELTADGVTRLEKRRARS
ncbi:MAG: hypothetical protein HYV63_24985 [Candidatus Schekmanbacteria bacterium]|nr:hypothetical protein [Candidatus Schekmanbacteria bacterium]